MLRNFFRPVCVVLDGGFLAFCLTLAIATILPNTAFAQSTTSWVSWGDIKEPYSSWRESLTDQVSDSSSEALNSGYMPFGDLSTRRGSYGSGSKSILVGLAGYGSSRASPRIIGNLSRSLGWGYSRSSRKMSRSRRVLGRNSFTRISGFQGPSKNFRIRR